ncbi:MAG: hypothetical protein E6J99_03500 [Methanobacteriota archaeon]|nr:MAG: hypothetical protein E6J99_03500 [Euryarchaeota archaeon]
MGLGFMVSIGEILKGRHTGKVVELRGWIYRTRTVGGKAFVVIRDATGILQATISRDAVSPEAFQAAEKALIESAVVVHGKVVADKRAPGGYEIQSDDFKVVHFAEKFPIQEDLSEEFLLDVRHLWVRSQKMTGIFRVRHTVFGAVHEYFREHGFWEVQPPMITPAGSEGGATLFEVDYFGRKAFLTQSWQLYAEALVLAMEKIYYVGPSFRAEKSRTTRHLTEYWHAEMEEAWVGMDAVIRHAEGVISQACALVAEERVEEIVALGRTPEFLKAVKPPFERMTYDEALKVLKAKGIEVEWGKDLRTLEERALTEGKSKPVIVTHYPRVSQAFYKARDPKHEALVLAMEKIYYVGPSFRAEKSRTTRHLTEYWHAEMEEAWVGMDAVIRHAEGVISQACALVAEERVEEIVALGRTPEFLKAVKPPFERMTYDEALKVLKAKGIEVEWGKDLRTLEERALTEGKSKPVIVTHYPRVSQAFYKARDPKHPDLVLGFDVIGGDGVGEIVGGSERETDLETIKKALLEQGEDPKAYDWYLDSRRFGSVQHAGFGMGMERLIQWICKLGHIRDAVPFPRTPGGFRRQAHGTRGNPRRDDGDPGRERRERDPPR